MKARHCLAAIALFGILFAAQQAGARPWPHARHGLILGFGVGGGSGQVKWSGEAADGSDVSFASDREGGFGGNIRIGYAFSPELTLAFDGGSWTRTFSGEDVFLESYDETWTLSVGTAALTWYPNGGGFYLRGGIGGGNTEVKLTQDHLEIKGHENGFGALFGLGYEWRLARRFALGPALTFGGMSLDHGWSANFTNLTLEFNWYL
jgi:hypothetical protein